MNNIIPCEIDKNSNERYNVILDDDGFPSHSLNDKKLRVCCDMRKDDCPYSVQIKINNEYVSMNCYLCVYSMRKK